MGEEVRVEETADAAEGGETHRTSQALISCTRDDHVGEGLPCGREEMDPLASRGVPEPRACQSTPSQLSTGDVHTGDEAFLPSTSLASVGETAAPSDVSLEVQSLGKEADFVRLCVT